MTLETEHRALGSMHSTREDNLQSKRPDTLKAQAFERMRYHFQTATWVAVSLLTSLSMATTIASRLSGGLSLNYTELQGPVFRGGFAPQTQSTNGLLTAVTFNLRYGTQAEEAIEEFRRHKGLRAADVVLLQEMSEESTATMAKALGYNYVYYPACVHPRLDRNIGNAVLSRGEIHNTGKIILPHLSPHNEQLRIAAHATTVAKGISLTAYSIHLETQLLPDDHRFDQVAAVLGSAPKDSPVIVGGDFNTPPGKELARMEALFSRFDMSRVSTSAAETWRLGPLEGVLDHIFARGMSVVRSGTVEDSHCSDHKPVWVEMLVEGGESS